MKNETHLRTAEIFLPFPLCSPRPPRFKIPNLGLKLTYYPDFGSRWRYEFESAVAPARIREAAVPKRHLDGGKVAFAWLSRSLRHFRGPKSAGSRLAIVPA